MTNYPPLSNLLFFQLQWLFVGVHGLSLVSGVYSLVMVCLFLIAVASLVAEYGL